MKLTSSFVFTALLAQSVSAHYIWTTLIHPGGESKNAVRQPLSGTPVRIPALETNDIRCNVNPGAANETVTVAAGSTVGFKLDVAIYHLGPAAVYLGKAPGSAASWDGSGANWFKIAERGATIGSGTMTFDTMGIEQLTTTIPVETPPGEYLLRIEQIGLHVAAIGEAQFYISCAQIKVTGYGRGNPSKVFIPGYVHADHPGLNVNLFNPPPNYTVPGPEVWRG